MGRISVDAYLKIADNSTIGKKLRLMLPDPNREINDYWAVLVPEPVSVFPIDNEAPCFEYSDIRFEYEKIHCSNGKFDWKLCKIRCIQNPKVKWINVNKLIEKFEAELLKTLSHD